MGYTLSKEDVEYLAILERPLSEQWLWPCYRASSKIDYPIEYEKPIIGLGEK